MTAGATGLRVARAPKPVETPYVGVVAAASAGKLGRALSDIEQTAVRFEASRSLAQVADLLAGAGQVVDGVDHGLQLGVLLGQAHDLGPVGRGAHAGLHLVETVEHLIETGLGQTQSRGSP
mgnify:CR=1 FL=1